MAFDLGNKAVLKVADSGDVLRDHSQYLTGGTFTREVNALEATHLGDEDEKFLPGLKNSTFSEEGDFDPTIDGWLDGIRGHADQAFEYYPRGEASGMPKYAGVCMITSYEDSAETGELGKISAEFQVSGAVTRTLVA